MTKEIPLTNPRTGSEGIYWLGEIGGGAAPEVLVAAVSSSSFFSSLEISMVTEMSVCEASQSAAIMLTPGISPSTTNNATLCPFLRAIKPMIKTNGMVMTQRGTNDVQSGGVGTLGSCGGGASAKEMGAFIEATLLRAGTHSNTNRRRPRRRFRLWQRRAAERSRSLLEKTLDAGCGGKSAAFRARL